MSIRDLLGGLANLVFVPHCPACDRRVPAGVPLCQACATTLVELGPACPRCAEPHEGPASVLCRRCCLRPPPLVRITAPYRYGGELAVALRRLKFDRRPDIGRALAPLLAPTLAAAAATCDLAVPIPLHRRRLAGRGFNQADVLLRHGLNDALPIARLVLHRRRATRPQSGLDARARATNLAGAFTATDLANRRILLFDDIVTTGATMAEAARALLRAGAREVVGVCAARAESC
jgi:ComF family protein